MARAILLILALTIMPACTGGAPPPTRGNLQSFKILSEQADPSAGSLTVHIQIIEPVSRESVRSAAESVIESFKSQYRSITINSYAGSSGAEDPPYAVSKLEGGEVTHKFSPESGTTKIPTH
ncbi:MAG TPA: hypothetical protein VNH22_01845 [Blastocatellia bacterium]|nr:hypothetical protein [Blastocatellia bacterium]